MDFYYLFNKKKLIEEAKMLHRPGIEALEEGKHKDRLTRALDEYLDSVTKDMEKASKEATKANEVYTNFDNVKDGIMNTLNVSKTFIKWGLVITFITILIIVNYKFYKRL